MTSALEEKLRTAFSPEQAHLLAEVIREAYDDLVKAKDFNELKAIVADLAQAQKRTEERVDQLTVTVAELAQAQKRTEERVEELAAAQKRTEERMDQLAAAQERTERAVKQLARQVGGLSEALGGSLEDLALEVVPEILEYRWGMEIEFCDRDTLPLRNGEYEFDLVIRGQVAGRPILVLGEVKSNITESEVERFLNLVAQVEAPEEIRPLFFGYRVERAAKALIRDRGAVMVTTRGKYFP
ncbi:MULTISPECIES: hypothetical protein [unclassified Thermosynechococcus]|uniref:hypothetical protein n=1 Tax=unclassified Thermosynechococcus TaxID=2622553 RepID=UPI0028735EBA|nr:MULTISPECIES: hypothetical protein [unclassified Thermosynechococcus]WNC32491.1 hypothetical protein RHH81_12780 [Thermosynechococcus sp. PKX95]WNC35021.1 hypothetical protein RHH79_12785 [Thermosynechococcus sp. PKX91]WNC37537.1 hypothetical protein RHI11_12765 [Thermosynechococcus sp. WL11]WNC40059.1 hypothetical protein RHI18_12770 [Thermosynechococcus sp. WL17]WNC42579.1 hypothetical protein RHI14_12755 [Thermosynechococcus sp. WL15]